MKKVVTLATTLALVLGSIGTLGVLATGETATETNLITNGGFEPVEGTEVTAETWFDNWNYNATVDNTSYSYANTDLGTDIFLTTAEKHSGNYALAAKFGNSTEEKRRIWTMLEELEVDAWYQATVWVKISGTIETAQAGVELRVSPNVNAGGTDLESNRLGFSESKANDFLSTNGKWVRIGTSFKATKETATVILQMGVGVADAVAYWDDVECVKLTSFNGDFETVNGDGMRGWNSGYRANAHALLGEEVKVVKEGTNSVLQFAATGEEDRTLRINIACPNLTPGKSYGVKVRFKATSTIADATALATSPRISAYLDKNPPYSGSWYRKDLSKALNKWQTNTATFTVPAATEDVAYDFAYITLQAKVAPGETVYFDDVEVFDTRVKFYDDENVELHAPAVGTISAEAEFVNNESEAKNVTLITAVYSINNGTKQLKGVDVKVIENVAVEACGTATGIVTAESGDIVKAMLLDGITMKPLAASFVLE